MADEETIIFKIELNKPQATADLKAVTNEIAALKDQNKFLTDAIKTLSKAEGDHTKTIQGATKEIEINKQKIAESTSAQKALVQVVNSESGSINNLTAQNKLLIKERNNLNAGTAEGKARIDQINKSLDANNAKIKDNVSGVEKQRMNIGNYASALDGLVPGLGGFVSGLQGITKAGLAFIATPIGAVIGAIGLALGALTAYFKGSEEGQDNLNKVVAVGKAIFEQFMNVVEAVGEAIFNAIENPKQALIDFGNLIKENIVNRFVGMAELIPQLGKAIGLLFEGEFVEAGKVAFDAVTKVTTGIADASSKIEGLITETGKLIDQGIANGNKLASLQRQIDVSERAMLVSRAQVALEVAKLREKALSQEGDARRKTIQEAIDLEKELSDQEVQLATLRLKQKQLELQANGDDKEAKKAVAEAQADLIAAEAQRYEATLRFQKQIEKLNEDDLKAREKRIEEQRKSAEDEYEYQVELAQKQREEEQAAQQEQNAIELEQAANNAAVEKEIRDKKLADQKKYTDTVNALKKSEAGATRDLAAVTASLAKEGSAAQKALAISAIAINAGIGISNAAASAKGIPFPANLAAILTGITVTLAAISQAKNALKAERGAVLSKYHSGGMLYGPSHAEGGIPFSVGGRLGFEAEGGETIINKKSSARFRPLLSAINQAGGGVKFAGGGDLGIPSISRISESRSSQRDLFNAISQIKPVVTVEDINREQSRVDVIDSAAVVQ